MTLQTNQENAKIPRANFIFDGEIARQSEGD